MVSLHRVIPLVDSLAFVGLVQVALLHQAKQIDLLLGRIYRPTPIV